jgi:hypothetical protein
MTRKHWKQRGAKTSAISERHFRSRLTQRYGLTISTEEYHQLARDIQNGRGRMLFRESLTRTHWIIRVRETAVRVVYDKTVKALATALPMESVYRDSDGTATAAANGDLPVPQDCQARAEGIAPDAPDIHP